MSYWEVTAITIYCDKVDDNSVTLMVYDDGSMKCTGYQKYQGIDNGMTRTMRKKEKRLGKALKCEGPECRRLTRYRDQIFAEEEKAK